MSKVVVVESPAKAKTINKYLGSDYQVLASYGHIRDLPPKDGSVDTEHDFAMIWQSDPRSEKQIKAIAQAMKGADQLILATDPDREGEAISWHVRNVLEERKALKGVDVKRVAFNAITKDAVLEAMANPRELDQDLIDAYLARRALDYLVGFTLSPVLWRKLPGAKSAGRVQSVALRLISEREAEIERFRAEEYWTVETSFRTHERKSFTARLTHLDGKKLDRFDLSNEADANAAVEAIEAGDFTIGSVEKKRVRRNPQPPFTTSTLQQEASRKLGFSATHTMQIAQRLYEGVEFNGETVGLITYMRTDGVQLAGEAISQIRRTIGAKYGDQYLPNTPRASSSRAKNAQEAHEAIRPTDVARTPEALKGRIDPDQWKLYALVWKRTVASQMASAELDQTTIDVVDAKGRSTLRATGTVIAFDGFLTLYQEDRDDAPSDDQNDRLLPPVAQNEAVTRQEVIPEQHFTQPPPRYGEASLVKKMEELGIGRPSTYASIMQVLQDRTYVRLDRRRFVPEDRGRLVVTFLGSFFERYVQYNFTADLEEQLDKISAGELDWRQVLRDFWTAFRSAVDGTKDLSISQVIETLDAELADHFFPTGPDGQPERTCPNCAGGSLSLRLGKFGAFIGCSNYPDCRFTRQLEDAAGGKATDVEGEGGALPRSLGTDPETGLDVSLRKGPYGIYVQLGEPVEGEKQKPKRASLTRQMNPAEIDLRTALALLALPRTVGQHPETGEPIDAGVGRFGPYLRYAGVYVNLPNDDTVLTIGLNHAVEIIAEKAAKKKPALSLGDHPGDGKPVTLHAGRYGPYVQHGALRATLPKGDADGSPTLERAVEILTAKAAKGGGTKTAPKKATGAKKPAARKPAAKKTGTKKTVTKKIGAKKVAARKVPADVVGAAGTGD
ncbi:MAG: type I DNA topoisomerase [Alphaproteobacteria bacterium]|nr:type I DNA topoisomerase [Alphaproteobacteria bacterium]